jgi:hypothetical protein
MPPAFGTGICKIVGDSRALAPKLQALSDAAQAHDLAKASDAATNVKAAVTLIQAQIDQLAPWPDGQVAVRRLTETMDGFQESMNLFITGLSPLTPSIVQQATTPARGAGDKLALAIAAMDALRASNPLPC